jgi:isopenicillin N synthase-like dioxygenase
MWELGLKISERIALSLNLSNKYFENAGLFDQPCLFLRMIHYCPVLSDPSKKIYGAAPHTDYGFITILTTDGNPGLQIEKQKGEWVDVPHMPGALIVNLGDMLEKMTGNMYKSTMHRVVMKQEKDRYSAAFFFEPNANFVIKTIENCGEFQEPVKFGDHLAKKFQEGQQHNV